MPRIFSLFFLSLSLLSSGCSTSPQSQEVEGTVRLGHEVRSFTDSRTGQEYWLIDKSGQLMQQYQNTIKSNVINYQPVYAKLQVLDIGRMNDGFGAEYDGTYEVRQIIFMSPHPHP